MLNDEVARLFEVLTSDMRETPLEHVAAKMDWEKFLDTQPARIRRIVTGLAERRSRSELARMIGVSAGRLTQIMDDVCREVAFFFGLNAVTGCEI